MNDLNHRNQVLEEPLERPSLNGWHLVSVLLLILVDLCWMGAGYRSLINVAELASLPVGLVMMAVILLVAYGVAYYIEYLRLLRNIQLTFYGITLFVSLFIGSKVFLPGREKPFFISLFTLETDAVFIFFVVLWLWWRGLGLARMRIRPEIAWQRFQVGLVSFLVIVLLTHTMGGEAPGLGWFAFFLFLGFLAVLSARAAFVNVGAGEHINPLNRRWIGSMAGLLGLLVILAAVLGSLITGQGALLLDWLALAIRFVVGVLILIMAIPAMVIGTLIGDFFGWLRLTLGLEGNDLTQEQEYELFNMEGFEYPPPTLEGIPANIQLIFEILQSVLFWGLILIGLIWLFTSLRRRAVYWRQPGNGAPESLLEPGDAGKLFRKAVQDTFTNMLNRLRLKTPPELPAIRKIYIRLLNLAVEIDNPRQPTKTPIEFQTQLSRQLDDAESEIETLTKAYVDVRYGELSKSQAEIAQAEAALRVIETEAQKLK
jgi:hypothetical protein